MAGVLQVQQVFNIFPKNDAAIELATPVDIHQLPLPGQLGERGATSQFVLGPRVVLDQEDINTRFFTAPAELTVTLFFRIGKAVIVCRRVCPRPVLRMQLGKIQEIKNNKN